MAEHLLHNPDLAHVGAFDAVVIGGGPAGVHIAAELDRRTGSDARLLAITQDHPFGGMSQRSLEQFRYAHQTEVVTRLVDETLQQYDAIARELGAPTYTRFPYIFVADSAKKLRTYTRIVEQTAAWGFDSQGEVLDARETRERFPYIDGPDVLGAVAINNAGRLFFDLVKDHLIERSSKVTFATGVRAEEILLDGGGRVAGVRTDRGTVATGRVILAPGAFVLRLQRLLPALPLAALVASFEVTQRELFSAHVSGLPPHSNAFVIAPGMAIVRFETDASGAGLYGYADPCEPRVAEPVVDPRPKHDFRFPATVYELLSACMTGYGAGEEPGPLARQPLGFSAGYYPAFRDELPVVDAIPGAAGAVLVAGTSHYGVMTAGGLARLAVDVALDGRRPPDDLAIGRPIGPKRSLVL